MRRSLLSGRFFSATYRDFVPIRSFGSTASLQISSVYRIPPLQNDFTSRVLRKLHGE